MTIEMLDYTTSTILSILSGIFVAIFTVNYSKNETIRKDVNNYIELLIEEIDFNRKKLPLYSHYLSKNKELWDNNKKLDWINHNEISVGYFGYLYNFLKFDSYNVFISKGYNLYLDENISYSLNKLFYELKYFCGNSQKIEDKMRILKNHNNIDSIDGCWIQLENRYSNIANIFKKYPQFEESKMREYKLKWFSYHIKSKSKKSNYLDGIIYDRILIGIEKGSISETFSINDIYITYPDIDKKKYESHINLNSTKKSKENKLLYDKVKSGRYKIK